MRVPCELQEVILINDKNLEVDSVCVVCSRCEHSTESFGRGENSVKRCLARMHEQCPEDEDNYYYVEPADAVA